MARLGAVVGLPIEAAILRLRAGAAFVSPDSIAVAQASAARAERLAEDLASRGATALLSIGIGGGLDPALRPGTVVLAGEIVLPDGRRLPTHLPMRQLLLSRTEAVREAPIAGTDRMIAGIAEKRTLHDRTGAAVVDMESHGVARVALRRALPLLVLRVVADPADQSLPQAVGQGLDADGKTRPLRVMGALLADPRQVLPLLGVTANVAAALLGLWRVAGAVTALAER